MGKRPTLRLIILLVPALILVACGGATPQPAPAAPPAAKSAAAPAVGAATGNVAAGKTVFEQNCNGCHPGGARGVGPELKGKSLSSERITSMVRSGGSKMPAFSAGQIGDQQLSDLVAYAQSLK